MQSNFVNETPSGDIVSSLWHLKGKVDYVDQWPLMSSPIPVTILVLCYLTFVLKIGPYLMKKRPPYQLKNVLVAYNIIQVIASIGLASGGGNFLWKQGVVNKTCAVQVSEENFRYIATIGYYYMLAKISELLDTVFFVLRKKQNQVTFLHVYHHTIMLSLIWYGLKYEINEHAVFLGTLNSIVHVVMYGYYCLSALPGMSKYLWWKKYITAFQLAQFLATFVHIWITKAVSDCPPSNFVLTVITVNAIIFYYLFSDFYKQSYKKPSTAKDKCEINGKSSMNGAKHANGTNNAKESQSNSNYRKKSEKIN